jgi:hypothetical protein
MRELDSDEYHKTQYESTLEGVVGRISSGALSVAKIISDVISHSDTARILSGQQAAHRLVCTCPRTWWAIERPCGTKEG